MNSYQILGVSSSATQIEIKAAYKRLVGKYHPDRNNGDDRKFKEVVEAYEYLSGQSKPKQQPQPPCPPQRPQAKKSEFIYKCNFTRSFGFFTLNHENKEAKIVETMRMYRDHGLEISCTKNGRVYIFEVSGKQRELVEMFIYHIDTVFIV